MNRDVGNCNQLSPAHDRFLGVSSSSYRAKKPEELALASSSDEETEISTKIRIVGCVLMNF